MSSKPHPRPPAIAPFAHQRPAISVSGICKSYRLYEKPSDRLAQMIWRSRRQYGREVRVLDGISFDVFPGESIGIIGVNGAGKSTLLQIICGTVTPSAGEVKLNGRVAALLELGAGFNPEFSGRDNVFMNSSILGLSDQQIRERLDAILAFADIGDFIDMPVKTYSSGMYVRLAFAVAAHVDPEILIVDEALSVGDFLFQQKCNKLMAQELARTTKLFVTHDFGAVTRLTERVLVLDGGRIIYDGDPATAIERYQIAARAHHGGLGATVRAEKPAQPVRPVLAVEKPAAAASIGWVEIPDEKRSGHQRARFECFAFTVAGAPGRCQICDGDALEVRARLRCAEDIAEPIIGYQIQDRFGAVIFGENSRSIRGSRIGRIDKGEHDIALEIEWPVLAPGRYALTLGLGNGANAMLHEVECWAHNILVLDSSSRVPVHGVFNVPIRKLNVRSYNLDEPR